jgi:hypothetical protein
MAALAVCREPVSVEEFPALRSEAAKIAAKIARPVKGIQQMSHSFRYLNNFTVVVGAGNSLRLAQRIGIDCAGNQRPLLLGILLGF